MLPPVMLAALVMVEVADIKPTVSKLPPVILPVTVASPPVTKLPPVTLPVALAKPAVAKLPPVIVVAELIVPVVLIRPPVKILPPVMLPLTLNKPVMYAPVVANTTTFDVPPIPTVALPPEVLMLTLLVPLVILLTETALALMLLILLPSPIKYAWVTILPVAEIVVPTVRAPLTAIVLAVITLAVDKILVHELVALEYWYDTWLTTVICPLVGDTGNDIGTPKLVLFTYPDWIIQSTCYYLLIFYKFCCAASHSSLVMGRASACWANHCSAVIAGAVDGVITGLNSGAGGAGCGCGKFCTCDANHSSRVMGWVAVCWANHCSAVILGAGVPTGPGMPGCATDFTTIRAWRSSHSSRDIVGGRYFSFTARIRSAM